MADNSQLTAKEILELRSLIKLLGKDIKDIDFDNLIKSGSAARDYLHKLQAEAEEFTSDISFSITAFQNIANELKNTYSGVNNVTKIYKGLTSIAQELQYHQQNISKLDEKGIEKLREKFEINQLELKNADSLLKLEEQSLEAQLKKAKKDKEAVEAEADRLSDLQKQGGLTKEQEKRYDELVKQYAQIEKSEKNINKLLSQNKVTQNEIKGALEEQDGLYNALRATIDGIDSQLEKQKELLGLSGAAVAGLSSTLNNLGFSSLSNQLGIDEAKSKMSSLAEKIVKDQKQQIILQEQINAAKENLPTGRYDNLLKKLEREKELEKEIEEIRSKGGDEKKLKAKEKALESIKAGYTEEEKVLGQNITNLNTLAKSNAQYTGMKGKVAILNEGLKSMGSSLVKNLTDPLTVTTFLVTQLVGALKSSDAATGELAKQFGTSYKEALGIREELNEIANSTSNVNINSQNLQKSLTEINKAFGTNAKISQEELITMTELTQQAGYQAEELTGIYKISKATGKDFKDNTKAILGTAVAFNAVNKSAINEREVLKEVNKASNAVKLSLGGSLEAVTKSVMQAKQFGLNLEQAESISKGLLEFESSISSELEAEMLTGKSLNFEKARLLALNNDIAGAAAEVARQVGSSAEFGKMNRIQQEALAKAVGLTRDQLADSLVEREALAKLGAQEGTALEAYNKLKKEGLSDEAIAAKLGNDKLAAQLESQSVQEQFNATVEKLKEIFVSLSEPILNMVNALTPVFNIIGGIASGIGTVINFFNKITGGALPAIIGLMLTWKLLTGGIGQGILGIGKSLKDTVLGAAKGVGSIFSSIKEKGIGGTAKDLKDSVKNKFSGKSKAEDLADKAKDKGDKASDSTKGGDNAKGFSERMKNIAKGIAAFGTKEVLFGALNLIPASIGLIAMIPGFLGAKLIEKLDGKAIKKGLEGLANGLEAMAKGKVLLGAGALVVASVALVAALPGMLAAAVLGAIGPLVEKGLTSFAKGIERLGTGKVFLGAAALAALGLALIPAAYALKQFSEVSWSDLGKAGVALLGLGIAGAAFGSFVPLMLAGAVAIAALGASLIPFGIALRIIAPALEKFTPIIEAFGNVISKTFSGIAEVITSAFTGLSDLFKTLGEVDPIKLFAIGPALASIGAGLAVLGGGSLAGGILGSIGKLFGGGVVKKLNELSSIDSSKILTLADAITKLSESIANLNSVTANIGDVSPIITTVDKVVELHDSLNKTSLEKVVDKVSEGVSSLFSKAFEFVSSVSSTDKTTANAESTTSASSLSSAASSKSLVDKTNIEAKEVILNVSDKAITNLTTDKTKELNKNKESDKTKELNITGLKEELLTNQRTNQLVSTSIDNLKVANLIVEKQTEGKTDSTKGAIAGATIGSFLGPLGALAGGLIGEMFSGTNEEEIVPINNEIQPLDQTISTLNNANNTNASSLVNNNQNITSNENVVKILQEAVTVLKAIQAKDTSVQLALDGDVIARKIAPGVNKEQVKAYSNL
jgi:hypothetical protein